MDDDFVLISLIYDNSTDTLKEKEEEKNVVIYY